MDLKFLLDYEGRVYLLTVFLSLTFGAVVFTLRRSAIILREKKWAMPFAITFFMLAGIYSLLLLNLWLFPTLAGVERPFLSYLIEAITDICSGVTNYLFILSAYRLAEPALNKRRLLPFKHSKFGRALTWPSLFLVLCIAGLMSFAEPWVGGWATVLDAVFSALALSFMGYVLYHSISYRHDEFMAKMALLASFGYAVLYLFYGLGITQYLVHYGSLQPLVEEDAERIAGLITSLISLLLKFGIFLPGYSLMLLVSGPLEGVDRLLENVTRKNKEYLESDGVVESICKELRVNNVRLYIKRPGPEDERVVLCAHPPLPPTLNGNNQEPQEVKYEKGSHYDRVLKSGEPHIDSAPNRLIRRVSEVAVPVYFHKSVIAVLYAERGERNFTEADLINLRRIATMVSPAVQAYRELDALNQISQNLAQLQIGVEKYDMKRDVIDITGKVHEVISPLATGVSIEIGFLEYQGVYPPGGELEELVERRLKAELGEEDETDHQGNRWFTMGLKISIGNDKGEKVGEQVFGKLNFMPESKQIENERVTVGTNSTFRRALSDLMTASLLNFIRGRLNQLTDILGTRLSGLKGTETEGWLKEVEVTAQDAKLLWVIAEDPETHELLGGDETVALVKKLESPERQESWKMKATNLWLSSLEEPELGTYCVIKKFLKESKATLWFGVARENFGPELAYISPWRYFLDHFCEIADSALHRIQMMKREEKQNKNMLLMYSTIGVTVDKGRDLHDLGNHAQSLILPLKELLTAVRNDRMHFSDDVKSAIYGLEAARHELEGKIMRLTDAARRNNRSPCSLNEAITEVCDELKKVLVEHDIRLDIQVPSSAVINVPFGVAMSAVSTILHNAKDALKDDSGTGKTIHIKVEPATEKFICHITDNGPGVPEELRPKIFNDVTGGPKNNSHGIGLFLSRISLRICGGDIILQDQNGHRGASFRIEFPRVMSSPNGTRK